MWKLYKLEFSRVHFGTGQLSDSAYSFSANRLFSALILEALKSDEDTDLYDLCNNKDFVMSDALPIKDGEIYLPKPIIKVQNNEQNLEEYSKKKKIKKTKFIPFKLYTDYINGNVDINSFDNDFGALSVDIKNLVPRNIEKDTEPFEVGVYSVKIKLGVIVHFPSEDDEKIDLFEKLLKGLQYTGLGGKRSSGLGKFEVEITDVPDNLKGDLIYKNDNNGSNKYILLTSAVHKELVGDNNSDVDLSGAKYLLKRVSGFIYDGVSSENDPIRKNDLYIFEIGSRFNECWKGGIYDVQPENYNHSVHVFAKPLFYKIRSEE